MAYEYEGTLVDVLAPPEPGADAANVARDAAELLGLPAGSRLIVSRPGMMAVELPPDVAHMLGLILHEASRGRVVAVVSTEEEISTGAAARLLGVSRPHVAKLVDSGILPGRKINSHRRVRTVDVMVLKRSMERRHRLLDELADETESLGLYDRAG